MNTANTPGFLTIDLKHNANAAGSFDEDVNIPHIIPEQLMRLRSYRVHMTDAPNSISARVLYIDLPFLSSVQIIDNVNGSTLLPLELGETAVTLQNGCNKPVLLTRPIQGSFHVRVLSVSNADGVSKTNTMPLILNSQVRSVTLQFELEKSALR